jgi:hypothetical protein
MNRKQTLSNELSLGLVFGATLTLFVLVVQAAFAASSPLTPGNPTPYPDPNTHTSPATTTVSITYDEPISPTTVSTRTFAVHARQTGLLTQTYGVDEGAIVLTPTQPFHAGEWVQVSATTGTLSLIDGTGPLSPTVWQFHVAVPNGSGFFTATLPTLNISWTQDVALGDVDGDGDLDAFVTTIASNTVWLNDGTGVFVDSGQGLGNAWSMDTSLGDVDGDGDLDAYVANRDWSDGYPNALWLNEGGIQGGVPGTFVDSGQELGDSHSVGVELGDVDGDGDLDAFVVNTEGQGDRVWLNEGGIQGGVPGTFVDSGQELGNSPSIDVALGDLDSDGDLDAFVANEGWPGYPNKVWLNNGDGIFEDSGQELGDVNSYGIALGDLDGDGDLDAFVANFWEPYNKVWLNNGDGTFVDSGQELGDTESLAVALGDVDADGDLDACVANENQTNKVWRNDGTGVFVDSGQGLGQASWYVELGDVDGDGDLDVYTAGSGGLGAAVMSGGDQVWLNLSPPQAADDAYLTDVNTPLTVAAPGMLGNDHDPDSEDLVAQVDLGPGHGTLALTPDGAFVYTPTLDFAGVDTFTYVASDGVLTDVAQARIMVMADLLPPVLVGPPDGAVISDTTPTLTWLASSDAAGYLLDWNGVISDVGNVTRYTTTALADGVYTWTLAAYSAAYTSPYTDVWSFTVDTKDLLPPVLVGPLDGAVLSDTTPTLTWLASSDAAGYLLDWNGVISDVGNVTRYTTTALADGVYTWTLAAYNAAYTSPYTDVWSFTVDARYQYRVYLPLVVRQQP